MRSSRAARAFTLIELMVVILIIAILVAISIAVASRVTESGKTTASQEIVRTLDSMLTSYMAHLDGNVPKSVVLDPAAATSTVCPIIDGRYASRTVAPSSAMYSAAADPAQPSTALLLLAMERDGFAEQLKGLDAKFVQQSTPTGYGWSWDSKTKTVSGSLSPVAFTGRQVVDAWGRAIRFVHPAYDGGAGKYYSPTSMMIENRDSMEVEIASKGGSVKADFSRSFRPFAPTDSVPSDAVGDADEGLCPGNTPYFYSAGSDGDPGTREDNVYTKEPSFPPATKDFN